MAKYARRRTQRRTQRSVRRIRRSRARRGSKKRGGGFLISGGATGLFTL